MKPYADGVELSFPDDTTRIAVLGVNLRGPAMTGSASTVSIPGASNAYIVDGLMKDSVNADAQKQESDFQLASDKVPTTYTQESLRQMIKSWGRAWTHVSIDHSVIKFAVGHTRVRKPCLRGSLSVRQIMRRIVELTGVHIPDPLIHRSQSIAFLISELTRPKAPTTLFQSLASDERLSSLKNVNFASRRVTPVDKEVRVGRWKIIEAELRKRHLPVTGRAYA